MVDLTHHGHQVSVEPTWTFLFGTQFAPSAGADPRTELTIWRPGSGPRPPGRMVGTAPGVSVFLTGG